jgi:heparan-alpha-glucosaminide N-acetyltransferase
MEQSSPRVLSIDVLRGLVMFAMVFVNDISGTPGVPWWMKHFDEHGNGMTFVDVVFPAFLFIVGLSIPVAIENHRARGESWGKIYGHVIFRTLSLLAIGVLMVEDPGDAKIGWPAGLWSVLMFGGVILAFHSIQLVKPALRYSSIVLRILGGVMLIYLAFKFRSEQGKGLEPSWWGILGLIGWAYFISTTAYILLRNEGQAALVGMVAVLMLVYFADSANAFRSIQKVTLHLFGHKYAIGQWFSGGDHFGSLPSITMCGVVIGSMFLPSAGQQTHFARMRFAAVFSILLGLAGVLLYRNFGINKDSATPTWCLWSAAITTVCWIAIYAIVDVAGFRVWAIPFAWAGASALLIYILSELWSAAGPFVNWDWYDNLGANYPRVIYHGLLTAGALSLLGGILGRIGFKLKL